MAMSKGDIKKAYDGGNMGFFRRLKMVIKSPSEFFNAIKGEVGYKTPLKFIAIVGLINTIVLSILISVLGAFASLFLPPILIPFVSLFAGFLVAALFIFWLIGLPFSFIAAGIFHIFAYITGCRKGFQQTYKTMAYSTAPNALLGWIPYVGIVVVLYVLFYSYPKGLSILHEVSYKRALLAVLLPLIIVLVIVLATVGPALMSRR